MADPMPVYEDDVIYHPHKTENYKRYLFCCGITQAISSLCLCPSCLLVNQIYEGSDTYLSQDGVHVTQLTNDCCCHLAKQQVTIPFDKITDVQLNTNCCFDLCGLQLLDIQTAGAPYPEGRILFVDDVSAYREKILEMKREGYIGGGGGGGNFTSGPKNMQMREDNIQAMSPVQKLRVLKEYLDLGILTPKEYESLVDKVTMSDAFHQQKKRIMDQF